MKSARVIKPDGTVVTAGPADVVDVNAPMVQSAQMYTDARQKHLTVPGLAVGDVLEYDVVERIVTPFTAGQFWNGWDFVTTAVCLDEELTLDVPADRKLKIKNPEGVDPAVTEKDGRRIYVWKTKNDKPFDATSAFNPDRFDATAALIGPAVILPRRMLFSTFQNWDEMGRWYGQLVEDRMQVTPELEETAKSITSGKTTELDKARAIYEYVAHIRYVSLSFGLGRYQPHTAAEVMANRYGDCKDKATLMDALLETQGIQATSALIASRTPVEADIPTPQQFDHAINVIRVDGKEMWLDSTIGFGPFGYLLPSLRGKQALVIGYPKESKLETTSKDTGVKIYRMDMEAGDPTGSKGKLSFEIQGGDWEVLMRAALTRLTPASFAESLNRGASAGGSGKAKFSNVTSTDPYDLTKPLRVEADYTEDVKSDAESASGKGGARKFTSPTDISSLLSVLLPETSDDDEAIKLGGPKDYYLRIKAPLGEKTHWISVKPMDVVTDFGEYTLAMRADDAFMVIDQHLAIKSEELSGSRKEDYSAFRKSVVDNASSISSREVKVEDPAARSLYNAAKRSEERRDYSGSAELYRQAVEKDPKYTEAWNALGWSYSQMQEFDRAEAALRKAIELDPKLYYVHGNLGYALFRQKKYAEAIEEYKKSEEIKPDLAWTHAQLGWSYLDTDKYEEAVTEFEQATKSLPGDPGMQFGLAQAYAKSGQGEKAMQAFKRSLDIEPTPMQMNNVAYQMALNDLHLDQARKYVESSISTTETQMKDVSLEHLTDHDLETGKALNYFWDTLGWIDYRDGNLAEAEKYIRAAWILSGRAEIGDHLGQIYEKEGKKQEAIDAYAESITAEDPVKETKARLVALAGGEANVEHATGHSREVWEHERKLQVKNENRAEGMAEFWVLTGRDGGGVRAEETKFIAGDEGLREAGNEIKEAKFEDVFVDAGNYKILRKGRLVCMSAGAECTLTLELAERVRGVN